MSKTEKIFNRFTWVCIVGTIVSGIYGATHGEQPTWTNVFLLDTFGVLSYGAYTWSRYIMEKDDKDGM